MAVTTVVDVHTLENDNVQSVSPSQNIAAGKTAIGFAFNSGIYVASVTDSKGNTWTLDYTQQGISVFSAQITTQITTSDTITVHWAASANSNREIAIVSVDGIATTSRLDQTANNNGFSGTVSVGPTGTLAQPAEIVFLAGAVDGGMSSPGSGYTALGATNVDIEYKTVSSTAAVSGSYSTGTSHWQAVLVTYRLTTTYTEAPAGTISLSGTSLDAKIVSDALSGSISLTGSSVDNWGYVFSDVVSGAVSLIGSRSEAHTVQDVLSGTLHLLGTIASGISHTEVVTGTISLSGSSVEAVVRSDSMSGTIQLSGSLTEHEFSGITLAWDSAFLFGDFSADKLTTITSGHTHVWEFVWVPGLSSWLCIGYSHK